MAHFLLIHGSCHGAWAWRDVIPVLKVLGHSARALDLPGHGGDATAINSLTMGDYARAIRRAIDGPTVLVGHSAGGYAITAAAELDPQNIERLIYVAAYVPHPGQSIADQRRAASDQPIRDAIDLAADRKSYRIRPDRIEDLLFHDCPRGTSDMARALLDWEAIAPQETALELTDRSGAIPKTYVLTENDRTVPPAQQAHMARDFAPEDVRRMQTAHSPFFAAPDALAQILSDVT